MYLDDTHPAAARVQIALLRSAGPSGRGQMAVRMSEWAIAASRRALAKRMPDADEREVALRWLELHYGKDIGRRVRAWMARRAA